MKRLFVFDLDGTLVREPAFYRTVYSGTLTQLVDDLRGPQGLATLQRYRETRGGRGELALSELGISYRAWAQRLVRAPLSLLVSQPRLCALMRALVGHKVIYTGSPRALAVKMLARLGFEPATDFDLVAGWEAPEEFPVKWACSPRVFESFLYRFGVRPEDAWAVGDVWKTDLLPAHTLGMRTALIGKGTPKDTPEVKHTSATEFLKAHTKRQRNG